MIAATKRPLIAVLYARFSPRANSANCPSCDIQIEYGREYCARMNYILTDDMIFRDDALSGGSEVKRLGLKAAKAACKRGMIFITRDVKRAARNMLDAFKLVSDLAYRGVIFETLTDGRYDATDENKLMIFGIKAVMAHCERMRISKDTSVKMRRHQSGGRRMSNIAPYGTQRDPLDDRRLVPAKDELEAIEKIKELRAEGLGYRAIGHQLEAEGVLCRGSKWNHTTIKAILERAQASV